ncbi:MULTISPECIES: glycoside hydrolase family 31 protein [Thermoanaerobacterium]|uniref:Glycoside hydrolase family protein n=2 Tax=Thermoanaerobacterium TaxID=28895 RepID=W9EAN9_9THEO|nr:MULTISPECIES: TIM-barrel domain-containing protein [Thermoanaerobacterium]AFK85786.1 glycoside hydrolase family 31 [Thermoanaerobacterium saccharolyticum JW/SL-YS485]ETO38005.1 glycoside hydrolase family protein [Thermoanaerobacterium aotearoense SCUT27]
MVTKFNDGVVVKKNGIALQIRIINSKIINFFITDKDEKRKDTVAIEKREDDTFCTFDISENSDFITIKTESLNIMVNLNDFSVKISNTEGLIINEDYNGGVRFYNNDIRCYKKLNEDHYYGFGEKAGYLDKKGEYLEMWNTDELMTHNQGTKLLYQSYPFFIGLNKKYTYGIFFDNSFRSFFDMGFESNEYYYFGAKGGQMNYYFIYGESIKEVVENYTYLTGKINMPPIWSLGNQQSRYSYTPQEKVLEIAKTFREKGIPCDVIYLDIDYMEGYRVFTWNKEAFLNYKEMLQKLKEMGFKVVTIIDPGIKKDYDYDIYREGIENDYFVKDKFGIPFIGHVWPGESLFPDFLRDDVRHWWADKLRSFVNEGVDGIWNDMNEPSVLDGINKTMPEDNVHYLNGYKILHSEAHNVYATYMAMATQEGLLKARPNERPFILSRAAFSGIQKYAAVWTGDNRSLYEHLLLMMPMIMNLGLSGQPFAGSDVGGFGDDGQEELFIRWIEAGVFTPFLRIHSANGTRPQEPWSFGNKCEDISKKYIKMRYEILPYIYDLFYIASQKGYPVMRPLVFEYQNDENTHNIYDEFMLGDNMLIAPIYLPSKTIRDVYLPKGIWYDYWNGNEFKGEKHYLIEAPIDIIPLFVKEGSIIPKQDVQAYIGEKQINELIIELYSGSCGEYTHYEDDGISVNYIRGEYNLTNFKFKYINGVLKIYINRIYSGYKNGIKKYKFIFKNFDKIEKIFVNNNEYKIDDCVIEI